MRIIRISPTFVEYAIDRVDREIDGIGPVAMRLVLTPSRVASSLVHDLDFSVHHPRGWSWPGFRVLFVLWLTGPTGAKQVAVEPAHADCNRPPPSEDFRVYR